MFFVEGAYFSEASSMRYRGAAVLLGLGLLPSFFPCVGMALIARITQGRPLISEFVLFGLVIWLSFVAATWLFLMRPIKSGLKPNKIIFIILTAVNYWIGLIIGGALYTLAYVLLYGFTANKRAERTFGQEFSDNPLYKLSLIHI